MSDKASSSSRGAHHSRFSLATWAVLYGMWVVVSGKFELFHLTVGFLAVAFFNWMQMGLRPLRQQDEPRFTALGLILYVPWLLWQMLLSALLVAGLILKGPRHVDPCLIRFRAPLPSVLHRVVLANSITLTPGTLTVDLKDDAYFVHALSRLTADDVLEGGLALRVARLSPRHPAPDPLIIPSSQEEKP